MSEQIGNKPVEKIEDAASQASRAESERPHVRRYRTVLFQIALAIVAGGFAVLTFLVKTMPFFAVDLQITRAIQLINLPAFALLMSWIS